MIADTNVTLSRWPFRRVPGDEPEVLVAKLRSQSVTEAWTGSFDGLLHEDIGGVNERLASDCRKYGAGLLKPFGSINLRLPDWQDDVRRCHERFSMRGLRLHPNYQGYGLGGAPFIELLEMATERKMLVQIAAVMEDERTQNPLVRAPLVNFAPLAAALKRVPEARVQILNSGRLAPQLRQSLLAAGHVYLDIAMVEGVYGLVRLLEASPAGRVLFGSYYPLFYLESATLKLQEAGVEGAAREALLSGNARALMAALQ
ncbi:MAG: amidohydrolase family protein [Bryobacterales bacterium]|nr:amidohydrolase family protein [Bryobacterales bacterium]